VSAADNAEAIARLDELTRRLRRECPWDREQDERSIVPHTVEESYELADAANRGDDRKLLDELGDVLFQVHFLSLLLEERGAGDLAAVAEHCRQKLIRRHPHVFGDTEAESAGEVLRNWDQIKAGEEGREPGIFGDVPENLPALLRARKLQRRAASAGEWTAAGEARADEDSFRAIGDELFELVDRARVARVDPELALRAATDRFKEQIGER
jgi:MazG family protein